MLGLCGILLVLFGVFLDNSTVVFVSEVVAGGVLLAGTGLIAAGERRLTARPRQGSISTLIARRSSMSR